MSVRTNELAQILRNEREKLDHYLDTKVLVNEEAATAHITNIFFVCGLLLALTQNFQPLHTLLLTGAYTLLGYLCLKLTQVRIDYLKLGNSNFLGVKLKSINQNHINFEILGISEKNSDNFKKLIKGYEVSEKINFTAPNKSKNRGNHMTLFTILNNIAVDGIKDIERKKLLNIIDKYFLIDGEGINKDSFSTLYSKWINEKTEKKLQERASLIKKIFNNN